MVVVVVVVVYEKDSPLALASARNITCLLPPLPLRPWPWKQEVPTYYHTPALSSCAPPPHGPAPSLRLYAYSTPGWGAVEGTRRLVPVTRTRTRTRTDRVHHPFQPSPAAPCQGDSSLRGGVYW